MLAQKPDLLPALVDLAEVELRWGAPEKAIALLAAAGAGPKPDDRVLLTLAVAHATKDDPDKGKGKQGIGVRLTDLGVSEMRSISEIVGRDL